MKILLRRRIGPAIFYKVPFDWIKDGNPSLLRKIEEYMWEKYNFHFLFYRKTYGKDAGHPFLMTVVLFRRKSEKKFLEDLRQYYDAKELRVTNWEDTPYPFLYKLLMKKIEL